MAVRHAEAVWEGALREGNGRMKLGSGLFEGPYSFPSRFEEGSGTNPEELIGAAHAGCFSMALSGVLVRAGFTPARIHTTAAVYLEKVGDGFKVTRIHLETQGTVPGLDRDSFVEHAETAKATCPISQLLTGAEITLSAELVG
jgi:lipoyl-dependent peroxiredoxin